MRCCCAWLVLLQGAGAMWCHVTQWGEWGQCTRTCGGGRSIRTRQFSLPKHMSFDKARLQELCAKDRELTEEGVCNGKSCEVDCIVSQWGAWSKCSRTCDTGAKVRRRQVSKAPSLEGVACPSLEARAHCATAACGSDCVVTVWQGWSSCVENRQVRQRRVLVPAMYPGKTCPPLESHRACVPTRAPTPTPTPWPSPAPTPLPVPKWNLNPSVVFRERALPTPVPTPAAHTPGMAANTIKMLFGAALLTVVLSGIGLALVMPPPASASPDRRADDKESCLDATGEQELELGGVDSDVLAVNAKSFYRQYGATRAAGAGVEEATLGAVSPAPPSAAVAAAVVREK